MTSKNLFGGEVVPLSSIKSRLDSLTHRKPQLPDSAMLLSLPKFHTSFKNALVFEGDTVIEGGLDIDTDQRWIKKNQICLIVCFGDFHVESNLINNDDHYWPVLAVDGDFRACNLLKGGMPLLVWKNLHLSGYMVGEYNDGPLRVGGNLTALGYVPRAKDRKEARGHVIEGSIEAKIFDAREEFSRDDLRRVVVSEALNYSWFNTATTFSYGLEGKSIWRDEPLQQVERKVPEVEPPVVRSCDPISFGTIRKTGELSAVVQEKIKAKIVYDPEKCAYPESFAEFVRAQFKSFAAESVLVLPPNTVLDGDLVLDWSEPWISNNKICAVVCEGDLAIKGDLLNRTLESGVLLFVEGTLSVRNVIKSGSTVLVLDNVNASGIVVGEYNDGTLRVGGNLDAAAYLLFDHDGLVIGRRPARTHCDDDGEWQDVLLPELFDDEEDCHPNVNRLWSYARAGKQIFLE